MANGQASSEPARRRHIKLLRPKHLFSFEEVFNVMKTEKSCDGSEELAALAISITIQRRATS